MPGGFRYKSIMNHITFWWDCRKHTCAHCLNYYIDNSCEVKPNTPACELIVFPQDIEEKYFIIESKWYKMTHLKKKTEWHTRIGNIMFKKDINQLLCENKEVK